MLAGDNINSELLPHHVSGIDNTSPFGLLVAGRWLTMGFAKQRDCQQRWRNGEGKAPATIQECCTREPTDSATLAGSAIDTPPPVLPSHAWPAA